MYVICTFSKIIGPFVKYIDAEMYARDHFLEEFEIMKLTSPNG